MTSLSTSSSLIQPVEQARICCPCVESSSRLREASTFTGFCARHDAATYGISWLPDSKSFFYTQMAAAKPGIDQHQNMQARHHVLGQSNQRDVPLLGGDAPGT
ncbi:MAG TPA: hypothetical protein VK540_06960 [Polyangiaceae bacterium]|nr:hypothetical protein [Polyangiaceae bacterium]